jgi:outer membrane protein OmpA-like peptidoglycan-associated protein
MKKISLLALALIVVFAGCGKKKCDKAKKNQVEETKTVADNSDIPVLSQETENLVDSGDVSDFAFVDDDAVENKKLSEVKEVAPVATNQQEYALVDNDSDEEEAESDVSLKAINFDLNKNSIRRDQVASLDKDCEVAKSVVKDGKKVVVQGHCCQLGSYSYNMALSQRRADVVKNEMAKRGVPSDSIKTVGCGNEIPLVWSNKTDRASLIKELAPNRRAEIILN